MPRLHRDTPIAGLIAALLAAITLLMLLVHGHAPIASAHAHAAPDELAATSALTNATATDEAASAPQDAVTTANGSGEWATRHDDGSPLRFDLMALATLGLAALIVRNLPGANRPSRRSRTRRRGLGATPVLRHEVIRV